MNLWQEKSPSDDFKTFLTLLHAYYEGKSTDMARLRLKIRGIWQNCDQAEWTRLLAREDPVLSHAINEFDAVIVEIV